MNDMIWQKKGKKKRRERQKKNLYVKQANRVELLVVF